MTPPTTAIPGASHTKVDALGGRIIGLARAFEPVRPLVKRARLMSMNARMTAAKLGADGSSFAVVAQALGGLGEELGVLVVEVEGVLAEQVELVSRAIQNQNQLRLVAESIRRSGLGTPTATEALRAETATAWADQAQHAPDANARNLWRTLVETRARMITDILALEASTGRLGAALARVERVAIMRGFFVGTNARIEAARLPAGTSGLEHLAGQLDAPAEAIAAEIRTVGRGVRAARRDCESITRPLTRRPSGPTR